MQILIFSIYWNFSQFYPKRRYFSQFQRPWPHSQNTQRRPWPGFKMDFIFALLSSFMYWSIYPLRSMVHITGKYLSNIYKVNLVIVAGGNFAKLLGRHPRWVNFHNTAPRPISLIKSWVLFLHGENYAKSAISRKARKLPPCKSFHL